MAEVQNIKSPDQVQIGTLYEEIGPEIDALYLAALKKLQMLPALAKIPLEIIYTNLHGTGIRLIPKALKEWGYTHLRFVEKQLPLDGNFSRPPLPIRKKRKRLKWDSNNSIKKGAIF